MIFLGPSIEVSLYSKCILPGKNGGLSKEFIFQWRGLSKEELLLYFLFFFPLNKAVQIELNINKLMNVLAYSEQLSI